MTSKLDYILIKVVYERLDNGIFLINEIGWMI
jgi:hypothetical protein